MTTCSSSLAVSQYFFSTVASCPALTQENKCLQFCKSFLQGDFIFLFHMQSAFSHDPRCFLKDTCWKLEHFPVFCMRKSQSNLQVALVCFFGFFFFLLSWVLGKRGWLSILNAQTDHNIFRFWHTYRTVFTWFPYQINSIHEGFFGRVLNFCVYWNFIFFLFCSYRDFLAISYYSYTYFSSDRWMSKTILFVVDHLQRKYSVYILYLKRRNTRK